MAALRGRLLTRPLHHGLRATAALAAGAYALHQLRYLLGFGAEADATLAAHGHGYLSLAAPLVAVLAALALGQLVAAVARAERTGEEPGERPPLGRTWLAATVALFTAYAAQELVEAALAAGHPTGAAALVAGGGWWSVPLSFGIGLCVALLLRGADAVIAAAARRGTAHARAAVNPRISSHTAFLLPRLDPLARNLAGRGPPIASR